MAVSKRKRVEEIASSSYQQHPLPTPEPPPKKRKAAASDETEKRLARFKSKCPQNIEERVERVMSQRFFLIDRQREPSALREVYKVLGSTGNVYEVAISRLPSCNCPDASKGNHCKHILFVFLKVLAVPSSSSYYYQKALLSSELAEIFAAAPVAPNAVAPKNIRKAYAKMTGTAGQEETESTDDLEDKRRIPVEGDDCPVCYEGMDGKKLNTLVFCGECGKALHAECFQQWSRTVKPATCVWCRSRWAEPASQAGPSTSSEGYLNLSAIAGVSPERDTSSYYHGPKKGRRYRYGYY